MRIDTLTPVIDAAPGEIVVGRFRLINDGPTDASYRLRVVGLENGDEEVPISGGVISAGIAAEVEVPFQVPHSLGIGHHAVALEISSDQPNERPSLAQLTVAIESIERVEMSTEPSTIRGRRRAKFDLDVVNHEPHAVIVSLVGYAPDVRVRLAPSKVQIQPGQRVWVRGRVRGPRRWFGEGRQHVVTFSARGRSSATSSTSPYVQQPLVPFRLRNVLAALVVIALWLAAVGTVAWWLNGRDDEPADNADTAGQLTDADGDGVPDAQTGTNGATPGADGQAQGGGGGTGEGGGGGGGGAGEGGEGGEGGASGAPAGLALPTTTIVKGTVTTADDGDAAGVDVRLAPIALGAKPSPLAAFAGNAASPRATGKLWPARFGSYDTGLGFVRQTESVAPLVTTVDGVWLFAGVPIRQTYELTFSKAGFNSRSFVVTPAADGSPWELDVKLATADGSMSGTVLGPGGPLGGAAIVITDGTLTFTTTSATTGDVGSWSVDGISTPGVYTLTSTLFGFGTEVLQVRLGPGEQRDGVDVRMRAGVGSISGRVFAESEPAGGITITTSNGDTTFTTSTLTEGDVGFYHLPQLPIPGDYTVTVAADGFIPQTRQVRLNGAAGGIDFELVRTTARLTGLVMSSRGGPVVGAGISVLRDDLGFRSATAAAPDPGSFSIDDLPPGTYVVRIERFDHLPYATQVTVRAGQVLDLGTIVLEYTARPPLLETGSLTVRILDSTNAELTGATVSIFPLASTTPIATRSDDDNNQSSFTFEQVGVGTYRVRATRDGYRPANVRVSVGLGPQTVDFRLFKLGQVSGRVVDSTLADGEPGKVLGGYQVTISRVVGNTVTLIDTRTPELIDGEFVWESDPTLLAGVYEIGVPVPPPGFAVVPDQFIDPALVPPAPMRFEVPETADDPIRVADIEADPYPNVSGFIYEPDLGPGDVITLGKSDVPSLTATLTCPSAVPGNPPVSVNADPLFLPGSAVPEVGGFSISRRVVGDNQLIGACDLTFAAPGYRTRTVPLDPPLVVSDGTQRTDRFLSVAMLTDIPQPLTGELFWTDGPTHIPVAGADIASNSVVVDFAPRQASVETTEPLPVTRVLQATSAADGTWAFTGESQVFGASEYTVTSVDFDNASFVVRMNPVRQVVAGTNLLVADTPVGPLSIELGRPLPGRISGDVEIFSTKPVRPFDTIDVTGIGPGGGTLDIVLPNQPAGTTTQTFDRPAAAGSWTVQFDPPSRLVRYDPAAQTVDPAGTYSVGPQLVRPNATTSGFDLTLLELGRIVLNVDYTETPGAPDPGPGTYTLTEPFGGTSVSATALQGTTPFDDLAVDLATPLAEATYTLDVVRPGYDVAGALVEVADNTPAPDPSPVPSVGSTGIAVGVAAGSDRSVDVVLEQYGTLAGSVQGEIWPGDPPTDLDFPAASLDAHHCDSTGTDLGTAGVVVTTGTAGGLGANDFVVSGPPGLYCIVASHPDYVTGFGSDGDSGEGDIQLPSGQWLYEIENTEPRTIDPHVLKVKRGTLNLDVVTDKATNSPVAGAEVTLFRQGTTTPIPGGPFLTDPLGAITIPNLVPGTYDIEIRLHDAGGNDLAFPVIASITIPGGPVDANRIVNVTAPLPLLQASITGTIIAVNSVGEVQPPPPDVANQVAVPATVTVTRTYLPSSLDVVPGAGPPGTVPNAATDADVDLVTPPVPPSAYTQVNAVVAADGLSASFAFNAIAGGTHRLEFSDETGYKVGLPGTVERVVAATGVTVLPQVVYVAEDVDLTVTVTGAAGATFQNLTFALTHGSDPTPILGTLSGNVITFLNLPPSRTDYSLVVDDDLHAARTVPITVAPDIDGVPGQNVPVTLTGDRARVTGHVSEQFQPASGGPVTSQGIDNGSIVVQRRISTGPDVWQAVSGLAIDTDLDPDSPTPNPAIDYVVATGEFTFDIPTATGTYRVQAQKDDQNTFTVETSNTFSLVLGQGTPVLPDPLVIEQRGRLTITTNPTGATVTLTPAAPNTGNVYYLTPDITYSIDVTAPNYYPATTITRTLALGGTDSINVVLATRTASVVVGGLTVGQSLTVSIAIPAGTPTPVQQSVTAGAGGTATVAFPTGSPFNANFLPLTGAGTLTVTATGYRTQTVPIADNATPITANVTMHPNVTTITGAVVTGGGAPVDAAAVVIQGTALSTDTNPSGVYTFTNPAGHASSTIVASKLGVGRNTIAATITSDTPPGATLTLADLPLLARNVTVVFTLNTAGTVTFDGQTLPESSTATTITFTDAILETATGTALDFVASANGFFPVTGSISITGATGDASLTVAHPLITLAAKPAIAGNVQNAGVNANSRAGLYAGACPPTGTALDQEGGFGDSTFDFAATAVGAPGTYCILAEGSGGTPTGTRQITVNANGTVTSGAATGTLVITVT